MFEFDYGIVYQEMLDDSFTVMPVKAGIQELYEYTGFRRTPE